MSRTISRLGLTTLALIAGGTMLVAQQSTGALKGRVADDKGAAKPGVTVTILNRGTSFTRSATTSDTGSFSFLALPIGTYEITYSFQGQSFKATRNASLGQETDASFLRWPTTKESTVVVVATAPQAAVIDTSSAQVGTTVTSEVLSSLPFVTRDINQAAILAPGVSIVAGSNVDPTKKTSSYIVTGDGMGRGTSFAVDGADNNSTDVGGYVLKVPVDAIQEFQVVTNQYKAEFGRSTAGFFNVVTKSGSNEFAGVLGSQYANDSLRAKRTDEATKSKDALGTYSATLSGPIIKDKVFFMVSAERQQGHGVAFDFSPYAISLQPELSSMKSELETKNVYAKLDWNLSDTFTTSWNYGYYQDSTPNQAFPRTNAFNGNITPSTLGTGANKTWAAGVRATWNVSSNMYFETHYSYFDYKNGIHPNGLGPGNGANLNLRDADTPHSPRPDVQNLGYGGLDPNAIQNTGIKRAQWKNELTFLSASHTFKGGIEYQRTTYADQQLFFSETGLYNTVVAGVNYVTGWGSAVVAGENVLSTTIRANGFQNGISYKQYGIYLQDDWNVNPNWSVYGGIRVDWDDQLDYLKDKYSGMYATIHANSPTFAAINGKAPEGKKYIEPRFQLLYRPNGDDNLVFKFGAGHFVANVIDNVTGFSRGLGNRANGLPGSTIRNNQARLFQGLAASSSGIPNFNAGAILGSVNGHDIVLPVNFTPFNYANNVGGLRDYFRNTVDSWLTTATADTDGKALLESDFQYPTTDAVNLGVSYRLNDRNAIDATVVYSKSKHLTSNLGFADGSTPVLEEYDSNGDPIGDSIFFSNQTASSLQLQVKYAYTNPDTSFIATLVFKNQKSSEGGAAGAFDASGSTGGLYGEGARFPYLTNPERISPGTEKLSGSFQYAHRFSFGTTISALAAWHSGKAYDVVRLDAQGAGESGDFAHPATDYIGTEYGRWAMDVSLKIAHKFKFGKKMGLEPYIVIQNLLNNYDYGSNYDGIQYTNDGDFNAGDGSPTSGFGKRGYGYQSNSPRNGAVGIRFTF